MDKLRAFLIRNRMTLKGFCEGNGFNYASFRVLMTGKYNPSPLMAKRISEATGGEISILELLFPKKGASCPVKIRGRNHASHLPQ